MPVTKPKPRAVEKAAVQARANALGQYPNRSCVPMDLWGRDHYSTLAYLECRVVDNKGTIAKHHMRTDVDRHPGLAFRLPFLDEDGNETKYPTRLACGVEMHQHDDWDIADDLCAAGLIKKLGTGFNPWVKLTERGELVAAALRAHKGTGGNFGEFRFGG